MEEKFTEMSKPNPATVAKMLKLYRNTKSNYEEELSRVKQENARLQQLLIDVSNADLRLHDAGSFIFIVFLYHNV